MSGTLYPNNYLTSAPRMIASIAYDPPRVANLRSSNNGTPIEVYRLVLAENQKVFQLECLPFFSNI